MTIRSASHGQVAPPVDRGRPPSVSWRVAAALLVFALLAIFPAILESSQLTLLTQGLIFGIAVLGIEVLLGQAGLISFGQAGWLGVGGYTTALVALNFDAGSEFLVSIGIGVLVAMMVAALVGLVIARLDGIIFAIMTLVIGQLLFTLALKARGLTRGEDGLGGVPYPRLFGYEIESQQVWAYFVLAIAVVLVLGLYFLSRSPFGRTLVAMRENPTRAALIGINVRSRRIVAFSISAGLGGLAGGLLVFTTGLISPAAMTWTRSGDFLLIALIGGLGTIIGPFLAGVAWVFVRDWAMSQVDYWEIPFGLLVIIVVLFFPGGVAAIRRRIFARGRDSA